MARRKKKRSILAGVPYALAMLAGAVIVALVDKLHSPWHLAIPWSLTVVFFVLWRLAARRGVIRAEDVDSKKPRVKRLV